MTWFFLILTVLFWGSAPIFEKLALTKASPYEAITIRTMVIFVIVFIGAFISGHMFSAFKLEPKTLVLIIIGGLFAGLLGQFTYFMALQGAEASRIVPLTAVYPLVSAILATLILSESFTIEKLIGIVLIIGGVMLLR